MSHNNSYINVLFVIDRNIRFNSDSDKAIYHTDNAFSRLDMEVNLFSIKRGKIWAGERCLN